MKKAVSVLIAVFLVLMLSACGSNAPKEDMAGKTAPTVEAGSSGAKWNVTFRYYLDKAGYEAVCKVLDHEITNSEKQKKQEQADQLKEIRKAFKKDPLKVIKGVSVAGPFNGWKPGTDVLTAAKQGEKFTVYTIKKEWEFSGDKEQYKMVFSLNASDDVMKQSFIWVPDPMASELKDDGFGGKNSMLAIPGFKASDDKKDDK